MKIHWTCTNCAKRITLDVSPFVPAKIHGPPERCYPAEGGEIDPSQCPHCNHPVPEDEVQDLAVEEACERREAYLEAKADARREGDV